MTCPSCGRIAAAGLARCPSCHSSLAIPADRPDTPTPIVRAPTNRGELAQRARGIFARSLVPRPQGEVPDPGATGRATLLPPPPPPPAITVGEPPPPPAAVLPAAPAHSHDPALAPALGPDDTQATAITPTAVNPTGLAAAARPAAAGEAGWAPLPPPRAAATTDAALTAATDATAATAVTAALPPVEVTAAYPVTPAGPRDRHAADPGRAEDPTEERPRPVRPGVDAPWPPPPGPWSGRRTSES